MPQYKMLKADIGVKSYLYDALTGCSSSNETCDYTEIDDSPTFSWDFEISPEGKTIFIIVLICLNVAIAVSLGTVIYCLLQKALNLTSVYKWDQFDFNWPSKEFKKKTTFIPKDIYPLYLAVFGQKLFLSFRPASRVPVTLAWLPTREDLSIVAPKLSPYPSWQLQVKENCGAMQIVRGIATDTVGRLWALDSGDVNCPPKLWIFNLTDDSIHAVHQFPKSVMSYKFDGRNLNDLVIDESKKDSCHAYISASFDRSEHLLVFSLGKNQSWRVETKNKNLIRIGALALSQLPERQNLYVSERDSNGLFSISAQELRTGGKSVTLTKVGDKTAPSNRMTMDNSGVLYFDLIDSGGNLSVSTWNTNSPFQEELFFKEKGLRRIWPFTFAFDTSKNIIWMTLRYYPDVKPAFQLLKTRPINKSLALTTNTPELIVKNTSYQGPSGIISQESNSTADILSNEILNLDTNTKSILILALICSNIASFLLIIFLILRLLKQRKALQQSKKEPEKTSERVSDQEILNAENRAFEAPPIPSPPDLYEVPIQVGAAAAAANSDSDITPTLSGPELFEKWGQAPTPSEHADYLAVVDQLFGKRQDFLLPDMEEIKWMVEEGENMPKGPANLGYFVSKDQTRRNADNVSVLVVHYNFENAKNKNLIRKGDAQDVNNLKRTFRANRNCKFRSILSPEKGQLLQLLANQEELLRLFGSSEVPSVFVLYILSHGYRDGIIFTDHYQNEHSDELIFFTTTEIFESLKRLTGFEECLKFINFGPCRGELGDQVFVANHKNVAFENENSCRITYSPLIKNMVVFFSTVETTRAKRNQTGSTFASLTCQVLNSLEWDESLINVLANIQHESHKNVDFVENKYTGQTPEVKMFSQDKSFVFSKSPSIYSAPSTSDAMGIKIKKKREFFSWKSSSGVNLRHRLAFLFSAEPNEQLKEIKRALSQNLDFETSERSLSGKPWASVNEASGIDSDIGCIFLFLLGRLSENEDTNEVCVQVDSKETAVSEILREFIGPKNYQWIGKPKILFLVNQEMSSYDYNIPLRPKMEISATNHSGWLVIVLHNNDALQKLIEIFKGQELKKEKSLQELLASLLISDSIEIKIDPLNQEQQIELFQQETGMSNGDSEEFITKFTSKDILKNPLHLSLVAQYRAEGNLYQIYDQVVRHKVEDSLIREGYDKNNQNTFPGKLDTALESLQQLASCHIRGVELIGENKTNLEKINCYGIATFENNKVIFIHQTFAEFLAAQYFLREIEDSGPQTTNEDAANLFFGESFWWCRKFVDLFYSTALTDEAKIEEHRASILPVVKLNPDRFMELIARNGCTSIFKMIDPIITFSENQEGNCISFSKDKALLVEALDGEEEIAMKLLDKDLINCDDELLILLPYLLKSVARSNATRFFEKLKTKYPRLPEMIRSRRLIIDAGVKAARMNCVEILILLLQNGVDIDIVDKNEGNALYCAISRGAMSTDSQLAKVKTKSGQTGLHILLQYSYFSVEKVRFLVEEIGVDARAEDNNGCTALHFALSKGLGCVNYLMRKDINLDVKNKRGQTCLHVAAVMGDLEVLQTWIDLGGDLDVVDGEGSTALIYSAYEGHLQFVKKLLACATEKAKNPDVGKGFVESSLRDNQKVNRSDNRGRTALHLAAESGNVDLVKLLLEIDADLTLTDIEGKNAIHYAINSERMLRFIHEKNGSLVKQRLRDGNTILHLALDFHYYVEEVGDKIVRWIVEHIDDTVLNAKNASGDTPLLLACKFGFWRVAEMLLTRNVEVNVSNMKGKTAMHYAVERRNLFLVKLMHENGGREVRQALGSQLLTTNTQTPDWKKLWLNRDATTWLFLENNCTFWKHNGGK
ncbi:Hypothetical predicted protein [Cloeon dipterum]|uniref:Peptidase C14 caspase domain-containing protein n=1 Tax=Cloeon dipterum TaxID=197152 RepID=A0A8S1D874_9INSE|nr:Hypothetical predicted protein [Cloeon dipterum]